MFSQCVVHFYILMFTLSLQVLGRVDPHGPSDVRCSSFEVKTAVFHCKNFWTLVLNFCWRCSTFWLLFFASWVIKGDLSFWRINLYRRINGGDASFSWLERHHVIISKHFRNYSPIRGIFFMRISEIPEALRNFQHSQGLRGSIWRFGPPSNSISTTPFVSHQGMGSTASIHRIQRHWVTGSLGGCLPGLRPAEEMYHDDLLLEGLVARRTSWKNEVHEDPCGKACWPAIGSEWSKMNSGRR